MPNIFEALNREGYDAVRVTLTPEIAAELLEANRLNRPLSQALVNRIASQITRGLWRYNGDTIKVSTTLDVLDGQHRLWAILEAKRPVETLIVFGIAREAFETIDTIRKPRNAGDTVALEGIVRHRAIVGAALGWLVRYERGVMETYKQPGNRVENSDVKEAMRANPRIVNAAERVGPLRRLVNHGLMTFFYYVMSTQNAALADELVDGLADPSRLAVDHPYYLLRVYLTSASMRRDATRTTAMLIKAANAAHRGDRLKLLDWRSGGKNPEKFPELNVRNLRKAEPERRVIR
jgi:hypothetical protein